MRATEVDKMVAEIEHQKHDGEGAHLMEDNLYLTVLRAIADGVGDQPWRLAQAALKTQDISMTRWYA